MSTPPTILIADDEHYIRAVVATKLRGAGFTVVEARDGEEALDLAGESVPDLVVTDLQMPWCNGVELCAHLKQREATATTPAVLLTARGHLCSPEELAATNIRAVIAKPFSASQLVETVRRLLAERGAGDGTQAAGIAA
jgi:CheY-like chemotaxis protein